ncbi:MAG: hypothetical protein AAGD43_35365 [Pseudomonadota bacterium]
MGDGNSILFLTNGVHPCDCQHYGRGDHYDFCGYELEYWRTEYCPAWLALFTINDLHRLLRRSGEPPDLCLATDISSARSNLSVRSSLLSEIFKSDCDCSIDQFDAFLTRGDATHVYHGFGLDEDYDELKEVILSLDQPYLTRKASWFTRRPIVAPELSWLEAHKYDMNRDSITTPATVLFGAGWDICNGQPINFGPDR